jgi:hypothetical protein
MKRTIPEALKAVISSTDPSSLAPRLNDGIAGASFFAPALGAAFGLEGIEDSSSARRRSRSAFFTIVRRRGVRLEGRRERRRGERRMGAGRKGCERNREKVRTASGLSGFSLGLLRSLALSLYIHEGIIDQHRRKSQRSSHDIGRRGK